MSPLSHSDILPASSVPAPASGRAASPVRKSVASSEEEKSSLRLPRETSPPRFSRPATPVAPQEVESKAEKGARRRACGLVLYL